MTEWAGLCATALLFLLPATFIYGLFVSIHHDDEKTSATYLPLVGFNVICIGCIVVTTVGFDLRNFVIAVLAIILCGLTLSALTAYDSYRRLRIQELKRRE